MPGRKYSFGTGYRYGFNGKENDNEVKGEGGEQDYGMRIYNPRIGKFLSVDPLTSDYPGWSPYPFAMNRPIDGIDLDGLEWQPVYGKNDTKQNDPIDYKWVGYNNDGTPKKGSEEIGWAIKPGGTLWSFTSDPKTLSGHIRVSYLDRKEIQYPQGSDKSPLFEYSIDIKQSPLAESFSAKGYIYNEGGASKDIDLTPTVWDKPTGNFFFNQLKDKNGLGVPSTAITAVYPEALLMPLPKLGMMGKAGESLEAYLAAETGGMKQWLRFGISYSKVGETPTVGFRWGAGGTFSSKIGNSYLRSANEWLRTRRLIPGVNTWWNESGHFHLMKLPSRTFYQNIARENIINLLK